MKANNYQINQILMIPNNYKIQIINKTIIDDLKQIMANKCRTIIK
jgi:hypothetical protein